MQRLAMVLILRVVVFGGMFLNNVTLCAGGCNSQARIYLYLHGESCRIIWTGDIFQATARAAVPRVFFELHIQENELWP